MGTSRLDRIEGWIYFAATVAFYLAFAWVRTKPHGATVRARVDALLAKREPAILLDSARIVALLGWMRNTPDVEMASEYLRRGIAWTDPVGVFQWVSVLRVPPIAVPIGVWCYRAALLLAIVGVAARAMCAVAGVLHALLWSVAYSTVGYSVHNHVVFMILLTLALAPEPFVPLHRYVRLARARELLTKAGTYPVHVRFAAAFAIVTVYVQTGIEKPLHGTPRWFNGITLHGHAMRKGQLSTELAHLPLWTLSLLALGVVLWETLFGLVFFYKKLRPLGVATGWAFHEFVRYVMGVRPFAFMMTSVLFVYTPYEAWCWIEGRVTKRRRDPEAIPSDVARPAKPSVPSLRSIGVIAVAALMAAQWIPTFLRRGVYPFLGNAMFSSSLFAGKVCPAEVRMIARTADGEERPIYPPDAIAVHWITFTNLVFDRYSAPYPDQIAQFAGTQGPFCQALLREVVKHAEPRAVELSLVHDFFLAGAFGLKSETVWTCRLDAPGAPGGPSSASPTPKAVAPLSAPPPTPVPTTD